MSDDKKSETDQGSGRTERPHATLDLTAERMEDPSGEDGGGAEAEASATNETAESDNPAPPRDGGGATRFLTHLAAGLLGGLIALVVGYYALGTFRDRLPFVSEISAEQIRSTQQQLQQRISELDERNRQTNAELADRLAGVEARTEGLARTDDAAVQDLTTRVQQVERQVREATAATGDAGGAERIANLNQRVASLTEDVESLRASLEQVREQSAENVAAAQSAALAVALSNLRRAVDSGDPYAAELGAVRQLSSDPVEAETLSTAAEDGVPTLPQLQQSFPRFANQALEAAGAGGGDSIIGQIVESARSVVDVRPVGEIEGDGPDAIVARIENRLKAGDLAGVIEQSRQLSGAAAAELSPWIERVETRIDALQELDAIQSRILAEAGP